MISFQKDEIEFLIHKGKLSRYTKDGDNKRKEPEDKEKRAQPRGLVLNMIFGEPTAADNS
mgnify:CR=1 FL=1